MTESDQTLRYDSAQDAVDAYLGNHPGLDPAETSVTIRHVDDQYVAVGHEPVKTPAMPWPPPAPLPQVPSVGRAVHYVSYGTPGGEYSSVCRAATITEVGAWMDTLVSGGIGLDGDAKRRTVEQEWSPQACALEIHNPTGLFFNTCHHNEDKTPGTWHWPERI